MNKIDNPVLRKIWEDRYCKNGETLFENYKRVAKYVSTNVEEFGAFLNVMKEGLFYPAGRTMSNAGIGDRLSMNNCFVAPQVQDDMESIFDSVKLGAITHKSGGGIGYDFSRLRPSGSKTKNDAVASGPVSFMEVFNAQTATILQGNRRGANMGILNVYHPDIFKFINAKSKSGKFEHFNLSVMVDDDFMQAVEQDKNIYLHFPVYDSKSNIIKDKEQWTTFTEVRAKDLWNEIMTLAYTNGEPGVFFYDNLNKDNNISYSETIVCTNPCSEYVAGTLHDVPDPENYGGACNLGSLLLMNFVENPFTKVAYINFVKLHDTINVAVRMLDNIIDINYFPNQKYENYQKKFRTIGLGVTGLADMLVMLNMRYDSEEGRKCVDKLFDFISHTAFLASCELAKEKGSFPGFKKEYLDGGYLRKQGSNWDDVRLMISKYGIRNAKIMSVAPTGTMSLTFGNNCSSGIEPIFSLEYDRKVKFGGQSEEDAEIVKVRDNAYGQWLIMKENAPDSVVVNKDCFITATNMSVNDHIAMLGTIAYHVDMSVSKTINIPTEYSFEDTKDVYMKCWKSNIKGCTIFRPNEIRQGILVAPSDSENKTNEKKVEKVENSVDTLPRGAILDCSDDLIGLKRKLNTGCGSLHVMAYFDPENGDLREVFLDKGSSGGCAGYMNGLSRMLSIACRGGIDIYTLKDQLDSTESCPSYIVRTKTKHDTSKGSCCPMAVGNALMDMYKQFKEKFIDSDDDPEDEGSEDSIEYTPDKTETKSEEAIHNESNNMKCPSCGATLYAEGGCIVCKDCGWNKCDQ